MMMKLLTATAVILFLTESFVAQTVRKNPAVEKIMKEVSAQSIKDIVEKLASFETRHSLSDTLGETRGIGAARRWIKSEFDRSAKDSEFRMETEFFETTVPPSNRIPHPSRIVNVVATLRPEATHHLMPDRILVITGHYDSRASNVMDSVSAAPGANDDASGTAVVMELARVMAKYRFEATIVFMAVAGEEQGLLGATAWAEMARGKGWKIEAVLNNDIVGNSLGGDGKRENTYVRVFSESFSPLDTGSVFRQRIALGLENDGGSRSLARYTKEVGELYNKGFGVEMVYRLDRFLRGGDHRPFHERGFRAVRFSEIRENYNHQHQNVRTKGGKEFGDLPKFMDFEYCANVTRVNAAILASLAWAPAPPSNVGMLTTQLGYETTLRWNKNMEPDVAGYFVRYRKTSSPVWQSAVFAKDTTVTLQISKDEYLFGVQAVDVDGNRSLIINPLPVR